MSWKIILYPMSTTDQNAKVEERNDSLPYDNCLNCGEPLLGGYCHKCGQQATKPVPSIGAFLLEYASNAFIWDPLCLKTIWTLLRRPGRLTSDYIAGKFVSQEHPLKFNMFLLLVFITLFLLFANPAQNNIVDDYTKDEMTYPTLQMQFLMDDDYFASKAVESPRDTVTLRAPLSLAGEFPDVISEVAVLEDTNGKGLDLWEASVPRLLIEDEIIVLDEEEQYVFNMQDERVSSDLAAVVAIWGKLTSITTEYFPMLMLLTAPFLAMAIATFQRRPRYPFIHHYVFSLHYTAFLELLMIFIYILYLTVDPSMNLLLWIVRIGSVLYLVLAIRNVYEPNSWIKAIIKALLTYVFYMLNCLIMLIIILFVACFIIIV